MCIGFGAAPKKGFSIGQSWGVEGTFQERGGSMRLQCVQGFLQAVGWEENRHTELRM